MLRHLLELNLLNDFADHPFLMFTVQLWVLSRQMGEHVIETGYDALRVFVVAALLLFIQEILKSNFCLGQLFDVASLGLFAQWTGWLCN